MLRNLEHLKVRLRDWHSLSVETLDKSGSVVRRSEGGVKQWMPFPDGSIRKVNFAYSPSMEVINTALFEDNEIWPDLRNLLVRELQHSELPSNEDLIRRTLRRFIPPRSSETEYFLTNDSDELIEEIINYIGLDYIENLVIWPIDGIKCAEPLILTETVTFRALKSREKCSLLESGAIFSGDSKEFSAEQCDWYGFSAKERFPKTSRLLSHLRCSSYIAPPALRVDYNKMMAVLEDFLAASSLVMKTHVRHLGGNSTAHNNHFGSVDFRAATLSWNGGAGRPPYAATQIQITDEDAEEIKLIFHLLQGTPLQKAESRRISNAIRRLHFSGSRLRDEDAFVDLMIAAESLYLDEKKEELSLRLALNAILWADATPENSKAMFNEFKEAYALRSKIVHGRSTDYVRIAELQKSVRNNLAAAILKKLEFIKQRKPLPKWEDLWFPTNGVDE